MAFYAKRPLHLNVANAKNRCILMESGLQRSFSPYPAGDGRAQHTEITLSPRVLRTCTRVCTAASHFSAGSLCHMHTLSGMYAEEAEGVKLGIRYLDDFLWIGWAISAKVDKANRRGWLQIVRWILVDPWEKIERCTLIDYVIANGRLERFCLGRDYIQGIFIVNDEITRKRLKRKLERFLNNYNNKWF